MAEASPIDHLPYAYLTTTGRVTGEPHRIEIWFAREGGTVYLLSGGGERSDWVRNLIAAPAVTLEIGARRRSTSARVLEAGSEDDAAARRALLAKYQPIAGEDLSTWGRTALAIAVEWPAD